MKKLSYTFYEQDAKKVARQLIGSILVHRIHGAEYRARIVETEAYLGPRDLASHSSRGRTKRTEVLFGQPGRAYVYLIYGLHYMLNITAGKAGSAQAVLIRAAEPLEDRRADLSGPGKLARAFRIAPSDNGLDVTGEKLFLLRDERVQPKIKITKRIGCEYAGEWKDALLRYFDADSPAVSRRSIPAERHKAE